MDILNLLRHQDPIRRKENGWWVFFCPFCEDNDGHLHLNKKKNFWHCFKCAEKGKIDISVSLLDTHNIQVDKGKELGSYIFNDIMETYIFNNLLECKSIASEIILEAILNRGLSIQNIIDYDVSICDVYPFEGRGIIFWKPYGPDKPARYLVARRITSGPPKYLNPVVNKNFIWTLFNPENPPIRMTLVEGFFDAHNVNKVCCAGALLGKTLNPAQLNFLYDMKNKGLKEIVILLDRVGVVKFNRLGQKIANETDSTMKLYNKLKDFFIVKPKFLEFYEDPGKANLNYLEDLIHG